jgi:DNA invertase Pin-like site-specific DNA recombinase
MSTDHQRYSIDNQMIAIRNYAERRGYEIVQSYADLAKSGLTLQGRPALRRLLADVESGTADYEALLIYDVSRFGRFQDADEPASYELRCRRAGVAVHYCVEEFENDGSIASTILKTIKRVMAAEFSRDKSNHCFRAQVETVLRGFHVGGPPGYGYRRLLLDSSGQPKGVMEAGERKALAMYRTTLILGPSNEIKVVRDIFRLYVKVGLGYRQIADRLNRRNIPNRQGLRWTLESVRSIILSERYIGNLVWAKSSCRLRTKRVPNDPSKWVRYENAFPPIVSRQLFAQAQVIAAARLDRYGGMSKERMLARLRAILAERGALTTSIINEYEGPTSSAYFKRFGGLREAFALVGYTPRSRDFSYLASWPEHRLLREKILSELHERIEAAGGHAERQRNRRSAVLIINGDLRLTVLVVKCSGSTNGRHLWRTRTRCKTADVSVVARMDHENKEVRDYYVVPHDKLSDRHLTLREEGHPALNPFRIETLQVLNGPQGLSIGGDSHGGRPITLSRLVAPRGMATRQAVCWTLGGSPTAITI